MFNYLQTCTQLRPTLGLISMVMKSLKLAWVVSECSFFSSCTSHCGARWMFLRRTQRPDLEAEETAFSARLKPSAEPVRECVCVCVCVCEWGGGGGKVPRMKIVIRDRRAGWRTDGDGGALLALLSRQVVHTATGIVA